MSHFALRESEMSSDLVLNENGQSPTPGVFVPPSNIFVLFFFFQLVYSLLGGSGQGEVWASSGQGEVPCDSEVAKLSPWAVKLFAGGYATKGFFFCSLVALHLLWKKAAVSWKILVSKEILFLEEFLPAPFWQGCVEASLEGLSTEDPFEAWQRGLAGKTLWLKQAVFRGDLAFQWEEQGQTTSGAMCSFPLWKFLGFWRHEVCESGVRENPRHTGHLLCQHLQQLLLAVSTLLLLLFFFFLLTVIKHT